MKKNLQLSMNRTRVSPENISIMDQHSNDFVLDGMSWQSCVIPLSPSKWKRGPIQTDSDERGNPEKLS